MKTLLTIALLLSVWHFLYEGIIAPSIRMRLRNRLFALRDELRRAHAKGISKNDEEAFWFVHDGINNFLNRLPSLTIEKTSRLRTRYRTDARIRTIITEHAEKVASLQDPVIRSVFERTNDVIRDAMMTNAGGWFIYIVPLAFVVVLTSSITRKAKSILLTPKREIERLMPSNQH
ncbi:hypothetical protein ACOTFH_29860 [Achromobacter xylosoxidans]